MSNILRNLALGVITIAAGAAIGYYGFGGMHQSQSVSSTAGVQETGTPQDTAPTPPPATPHLHPLRANSDYTAPDAPRIHIVEAKSPTLGSSPRPRLITRSSDTTDTTDIPTPDVEASQEAAKTTPVPDTSSTTSPVTTPPSIGRTGSTDSEASQAATSTSPAITSSSNSPNLTPSASSLPSASPDPEASQTGDTTTGSAKSGGAALYRIQAGTFGDSKNAHDYLSTLQSRGYDASVYTEHQGSQTVYHVQVGAYHDRAAAEDAAAGFRHSGVPVTVAPISP